MKIMIGTTHGYLRRIIWLIVFTVASTQSAIVPPPWANPATNPCATQPRGWQLLYWPADGKCYKIFQVGYPCPETMELSPTSGSDIKAECRCPPGTAQSPRDALCHQIFTKASCPVGQYFAPVPDPLGKPSGKNRWGTCREPEPCDGENEIFWPRDGKCYPEFSRGPCPRGDILVRDEDGIASCGCSKEGELGKYYSIIGSPGCYEHYSKGPCQEPGELFLPSGDCGCYTDLPHYHPKTKMCYPLGGIGPCPQGHQFILTKTAVENLDEPVRAECTCKSNYIRYENDGNCYRPHTRGPCQAGDILMNSTSCVPIPCKRGRLYFPHEKTCYKIGSRGPCPHGQIVLYDYSARPSVDGITFNGVCGHRTSSSKISFRSMESSGSPACDDKPGSVLFNKTCYNLYKQGPCAEGEWLIPRRQPRGSMWRSEDTLEIREIQESRGICECRPGYTRITDSKELETNSLIGQGKCQPPTVSLAKFLNANIKSRSL